MTLALYAIGQGFVVQATDRLLTLAGVMTAEKHDVNSNKTLVYEGDGVRALVSYTGLAYVGRVPMDHFIAEALANHPIESGPFFQTGRRKLGDLTAAARRLTVALNSPQYTAALRGPHGVFISIVGWRWKTDSRLNPFAWAVDRGSDRCFRIFTHGLPRYWAWDRRIVFIGSPNPGSELLNRLGVPYRTMDDVADALSGAIRKVSASYPTVGPSTLTTILNACTGEVRFRFESNLAGPQYTPWVITRSGILHPSEVTGAPLSERLGGLKLYINADMPHFGSTGSQIRKSPPQVGR